MHTQHFERLQFMAKQNASDTLPPYILILVYIWIHICEVYALVRLFFVHLKHLSANYFCNVLLSFYILFILFPLN